MRKKIVFTGGGSTGHVILNLSLIPHLKDWDISYIGSTDGIESSLIKHNTDVQYYPIATGKLRRYFDKRNFSDPYKVVQGVIQAYKIIKRVQPDIIFSKGGFVSVPVVIAGWMNNVPVVIHESDITPGLANKIALPFATKLLTTFPQTKRHISKSEFRVEHVGAVVREEIFKGNGSTGLEVCGFNNKKPILLIMGGSLGSKTVNNATRTVLLQLLEKFQVAHLCGRDQIDNSLLNLKGYKQFEYLNEELPHIIQMADLVVSRAGSNAIFELLAAKKPMILIPLPRTSSRGDQIENANFFKSEGYCEILEENELELNFFRKIVHTFTNRHNMVNAFSEVNIKGNTEKIVNIIKNHAK